MMNDACEKNTCEVKDISYYPINHYTIFGKQSTLNPLKSN